MKGLGMGIDKLQEALDEARRLVENLDTESTAGISYTLNAIIDAIEASRPQSDPELTVEDVEGWLRRFDGRIEDIFGLWVQGKRDDRWVAEKLIEEGHIAALTEDPMNEQDEEWGNDLDVAEWLVWFARKTRGKARDVAKQALDQHPGLRFSERALQGDPGLREALAFLRKRLVGTPPNVDMEDAWMASLLDEAEQIGRATLAASSEGLDVERLARAMNEAWPADEQLVDDSAVWCRFAPLVAAAYLELKPTTQTTFPDTTGI